MTMQANELIEIRKALGMTQKDLAEELGVNRKTIMRMEDGGEIDRRTELAVRHLIKEYLASADLTEAQKVELDQLHPSLHALQRRIWMTIAATEGLNEALESALPAGREPTVDAMIATIIAELKRQRDENLYPDDVDRLDTRDPKAVVFDGHLDVPALAAAILTTLNTPPA